MDSRFTFVNLEIPLFVSFIFTSHSSISCLMRPPAVGVKGLGMEGQGTCLPRMTTPFSCVLHGVFHRQNKTVLKARFKIRMYSRSLIRYNDKNSLTICIKLFVVLTNIICRTIFSPLRGKTTKEIITQYIADFQ